MKHYKLGKKPARMGAVKLKAKDYIDLSKLPARPPTFDHTGLVKAAPGMLGNDQYGDCFWAGSCHETMVMNASAGKQVSFTTQDALNAYAKATGFSPNDPNSDQGTDMQQGAAFRQKTGIVDANGVVHKVAAYLALEPGNWEEFLTLSWLFEGAVGVGLDLPNSAEAQFDANKPWAVAHGAKIEGGHYVSLVAYDGTYMDLSTWGRFKQPTEKAFFQRYNDEGLVYVSNDIFNGTKTIDGFDLQQLQADLAAIQQ